MVLRVSFQAIFLLVIVTTEGFTTELGNRTKRSGGFPKFPIAQFIGCGTRLIHFVPDRSPKIVGGVEPPYGSYPWMVDIQSFSSEIGRFKHLCGGALIAARLVALAAHCLQSPNNHVEQIRVVAGQHRRRIRDDFERAYKVDKILTHPDFRKIGPYSNDIALLRIAGGKGGGVAFNPYVSPICLPDLDDTPPPGTWCSVTGWGAQNADNQDGSLSDVLRTVGIPILDQETCRRPGIYGGRQQPILDTMVCAGRLQGGADACGGDSGGPLSCEHRGRFILAGIVSWGDGCAKRNRPGVYTRVSSYIEWIQESAAKMGVNIS